MIETLYRTGTPEKDKSECYVLVLASRPSKSVRSYAFMQEHGMWNEAAGRFQYCPVLINAEEFLTHEDALALYRETRERLFQEGFIYSSIDGFERKEPSQVLPAITPTQTIAG